MSQARAQRGNTASRRAPMLRAIPGGKPHTNAGLYLGPGALPAATCSRDENADKMLCAAKAESYLRALQYLR